MSSISWSALESFNGTGFSTSTASSGDNWFLSFVTSIATGLTGSYVWPGSGGGSLASAGVALFGAGRTARAGNSAVTGGYGNGFLLLNQNHISLHHIGSSWTGILGHSKMEDHGSGAGRWVTQTGNYIIDAGLSDISFGTKTEVFGTPYAVAPPFVELTVTSGAQQYIVNVSNITTGGFSSVWSALAAANPGAVVRWVSDGTV